MKEQIDHDQIFKTLIKEFFREFMELFLPGEAGLIDYHKLEFLDKEQFTDLPKGRRRYLDMLVKAGLVDGGEEYILVHVEFESGKPSGKSVRLFNERMYLYHSQIYLRHRKPVIPLAIFIDDHKWRKPFAGNFKLEFNKHCYVDFNYHLVKLKNLDWRAFLKSSNPLAYALMAKMDLPKDKRWRLKADFLRWILGADINPARRSLLLEFIETYVKLSNEEQKKFDTLVKTDDELTEVIKMITVYEERGIQQGELKSTREAVLDILKTRFRRVPRTVRKMVNDCDDLATLKSLLRHAVLVKKVDDLKI